MLGLLGAIFTIVFCMVMTPIEQVWFDRLTNKLGLTRRADQMPDVERLYYSRYLWCNNPWYVDKDGNRPYAGQEKWLPDAVRGEFWVGFEGRRKYLGK